MSRLSRLWKDEGEKDRCGAGFLRTPSSDRLTPACMIHDIEYVRAENGQSEKTRKEVDGEFLKRMLELSRFERKWYVRALLKVQAYTYYGIVRLVGGFFWDGKE